MPQYSSNFPYQHVTHKAITVRASHRDGERLHWVDRFLDFAYPGTVAYAIYRATQHPYVEYFLAEEAVGILATLIVSRLAMVWWCWRTLTVIFTPLKLIIRTGWRSYVLDAKENYGFSKMPHQDRRYRKSQYLKLTHHILLEHGTHGTILLGNVFGELIARQVVSKLQGTQAWVKKLDVRNNSGR